MQKSGISKIANYLKDQIKLDYNLQNSFVSTKNNLWNYNVFNLC